MPSNTGCCIGRHVNLVLQGMSHLFRIPCGTFDLNHATFIQIQSECFWILSFSSLLIKDKKLLWIQSLLELIFNLVQKANGEEKAGMRVALGLFFCPVGRCCSLCTVSWRRIFYERTGAMWSQSKAFLAVSSPSSCRWISRHLPQSPYCRRNIDKSWKKSAKERNPSHQLNRIFLFVFLFVSPNFFPQKSKYWRYTACRTQQQKPPGKETTKSPNRLVL